MPETPDLQEFESIDERVELRRQLADAHQRIRQMRTEKAALIEAVHNGARDALTALGPVPPVKPPKADTRKRPAEVALWHLTDWQGSKVTTSYNTEVMRERVMRFCGKAAKLTAIQRNDHPVRECVILLGGDMVEGLFNFPAQPFEIDASIFGQYTAAARLEADVVRSALGLYEKVTVIQEWGNHGRVGNKRAAVPRSDNIDRMVSALAREIVGDNQGLVSWTLGDEDIQRVEIGNYRALLIHGDEIGRNGYASPQTIVRHIAQWKSGVYPWAFRDCYVGHYHNHSEWSLPDGEGAVFYTGSPESDNRYAMETMASSATPSQRLHFIDPAKGRVTCQYKVMLNDG